MDQSLGDPAACSLKDNNMNDEQKQEQKSRFHPDGAVINLEINSEISNENSTLNKTVITEASNVASTSCANLEKIKIPREKAHTSNIDSNFSRSSQPVQNQISSGNQVFRDDTQSFRLLQRENNEEVTPPQPSNIERPPIAVGSNRQRIHRLSPRDRHGVFMNYLFLNLTLRYVTYFKSTTRRLIEFFSLLNALLMFAVLVYIHLAFVRHSGDCLNHVRHVWPQNGILRVQISFNKSDPSYQLLYIKNDIPASVMFQSTPYNAMFKLSLPILPKDLYNYIAWKQLVTNSPENNSEIVNEENMCRNENDLNTRRTFHLLQNQCPLLKRQYIEELNQSFFSIISSLTTDMSVEYRNSEETSKTLDETAFDILSSSQKILSEILEFDPPPVRDYYAIEYSTEFGFLRLSPNTRIKLGIPTLLVNLNPEVDKCFGNHIKKFILQTFLGYDDFLMSSIKNLAENGKSQGYLRNCVTGEYFRFVTVWVNHTSGIIAFAVMVIFTLIVSMLLRYSYHQIFMFMMEMLRVFSNDIRLVFPAAPMLTIVLALVGMEEIMTEFFHDSTVAFYVILLIWSADQFDVNCLHTVVGRRHWVRFFFLYHFAFYIYNYKFNGQYSKLALFTSWLFILHSMIYFFHHYEIPAIQRQLVLINQRTRPNNRNTPNQPDPSASTGLSEATHPHNNESSVNFEPGSSEDQHDNHQRQSVARNSNSAPTPGENNRLILLRCQFSTLFNVYLPYACSCLLVVLAVTFAAVIFSRLTFANHNLAVLPIQI